MKNSLYDRIWRRESGEASSHVGIRGFYGSREWMNDMDIVNELGGHTGCVNALSWSKSGRLLASGSDDKHLNVYTYQPDSSTAPFALNTTVLTGHRANIFAVKFMPHSNDRTLITCAGDSQVRVFDLEHSTTNGNAASASTSTASARSQRFNNFFGGMRYLSEGNTNARVYRSHADRVKRIVTESSPFLFLTCSEDGEVRQWDLRQPSSAYPPPRGGQGFMAFRPGLEHDDSNVHPPLISYKQHHLDLNTISCSPSQPHYIALGGAHLHCFLHDRRMLGRNQLAEKGTPAGSPRSGSSRDDEAMAGATKCVRRFAPGGKKRMSPRDNGHITACKISDANPNEMIASWSGDHIYSFDLIRSADAREDEQTRGKSVQSSPESRRRQISRNKKRKRQKRASVSSESSGSRHEARRRSEEEDGDGELAFRVRYGNGESEDIPIPSLTETITGTPGSVIEQARNSVLNDAQRLSMRIAKGLVKLRKSLFSLESCARETAEEPSETDLNPYTAVFSSALTLASTYLPQMDEVMRTWRYPMNPTPDIVGFQQSLRRNRESAWRFVQAAGTLSRVLGGEIQNGPGEEGSSAGLFRQIRPAPGENDSIYPESQFGYDFLKAILLWLEGGRHALVDGFKRDPAHRRSHARFPIAETADENAIETDLIPYLEDLAGDSAVVNVDASRFEHDSNRILFQSQHAAVTAFGNAVELPLEDLENSAARTESDNEPPGPSNIRALDRSVATRFWALKVGRGILMETGTGVNYEFVNRAFGGLRATLENESDSEAVPERSQDDAEANIEEEPIRDVNLVRPGDLSSGSSLEPDTRPIRRLREHSPSANGDDGSEESFFEGHNQGSEIGDFDSDLVGDSDDDDDDDDDDDGEGVPDDSSDEDGPEAEERLFRRCGMRRRRREDVELDVPCSSHNKVYRGHCNIKTVKDVNFFGLNDEYVVSGSDSGHLFFWDRKTSDLVNILAGDGEVVNVVQGHPYEPTIAASGIDNTIKIFSPDRRAQHDARQGLNILDPDNAANTVGPNVSGITGLKSCKRMHDSYQIMSQNDVDRQGGMNEAFITRSMLSRLAATLRERQGLGGGPGGPGGPGGADAPPFGGAAGEGGTIVLDENCQVM
ncbi:hypothetical protein PHISP_07407 [Aspergillus sp. HF37]|nr:hypothetical protein PHISP_07407 [Aspergillus sp. HF37]